MMFSLKSTGNILQLAMRAGFLAVCTLIILEKSSYTQVEGASLFEQTNLLAFALSAAF